jgi:hypothetical protein
MPTPFQAAMDAWVESHSTYIAAREEYRRSWAAAYLASQSKTADARKAEADVATSELRFKRDVAELSSSAQWQEMLFERGPMSDSRIPGQHLGADT